MYISQNKINLDQFVKFIPISAYLGVNTFCGDCLNNNIV